MSSSRPPAPRNKRPWYLVIALALTMFFGMSGWLGGCQTISEYREPSDGVERQIDLLPSAVDREAARAANEHYVTVLDAAKKRQFPIGVAEFLLGAAMLALTIRAIAGRQGARNLLVQMTLVQCALVLFAYFATADVRAADLARFCLTMHLSMEPLERASLPLGMVSAICSASLAAWIGVRTLASLLTVFALTRRGTRDFFDASETAVSSN